MYDCLKMVILKVEKDVEEVGFWDKELREVKEKIVWFDEEKVWVMNYKKIVEQKRIWLFYSIVDL